MDTIFLKDLIISGHHGTSDKERRRAQRFRVNVIINFDTRQAAHTDDLSDTFDYYPLKAQIDRIIRGPSKNLIESLAQNIADLILMDKRIQRVTVTVEKIDIWKNCVAGVTITRSIV